MILWKEKKIKDSKGKDKKGSNHEKSMYLKITELAMEETCDSSIEKAWQEDPEFEPVLATQQVLSQQL